jgi:hypothetical protein
LQCLACAGSPAQRRPGPGVGKTWERCQGNQHFQSPQKALPARLRARSQRTSPSRGSKQTRIEPTRRGSRQRFLIEDRTRIEPGSSRPGSNCAGQVPERMAASYTARSWDSDRAAVSLSVLEGSTLSNCCVLCRKARSWNSDKWGSSAVSRGQAVAAVLYTVDSGCPIRSTTMRR